jgi:hypothetical protein
MPYSLAVVEKNWLEYLKSRQDRKVSNQRIWHDFILHIYNYNFIRTR